MGGLLPPQALQDAQIELETTRWFWESTEDQVPELIDATIRRIADRDYPFWEDNEEAILQHERTEHEMRRIARSTTLLQVWAIFEDAACWATEERRRQGHAIGMKRSGESFAAWAAREFMFPADTPWDNRTLEWMEMLCRLRNLIIHTNGQYTRMKTSDRERVNEWVASKQGMLLSEGRLEVSTAFVSTTFRVVSSAIFALSKPFCEQPD
jgi:hypothetical protein